VGLNYEKDFMTTHLINILENREEKITNFTTRGLQFHFHNPSEHTIDGQEFDLELHIVHKLMYAQKNQEFLFENWRYAVTTIFITVPDNEKLLSSH
jgi:carbonic anhydrase